MSQSPSKVRACRQTALVLAATVAAALSASPSSAQVAPVGSHHATSNGGAGLSGAVPQTAGFASEVDLDLPAARGSVPVPLSVRYTGSTRVGAAGAGWDIPLTYVRLSTSKSGRKPALVGGGPPARLFLVIDGAPTLMHESAMPGRYTPMTSPEYLTLDETLTGWVARDASGRELVFSRVRDLYPPLPPDDDGQPFDDGLWLLTTIRERLGTDEMQLSYRIDAQGCYRGRPQILLDKLAYSHNAAGDALVEVDLAYRQLSIDDVDDERLPYQATCDSLEDSGVVPAILDVSFDDGQPRLRTDYVERIDVRVRDASGTRTGQTLLRSYCFDYGKADADTFLPRLTAVDMTGEAGACTGARLPVARYTYGSATDEGALNFAKSGTVPRFFHRPADAESLASSTVERYEYPPGTSPYFRVEETRTNHIVHDFTGDGLPDSVFRYKGKLWMVPNGTDASGTRLDDESALVKLGDKPLGFETTRTPLQEPDIEDVSTEPVWLSEGFGWIGGPSDGAAVPVHDTWVQVIDWNGDGRADIVDALGGRDRNHWRVWINTPHPTDGPQSVTWRSEDVFIDGLRSWLNSRGYDTEGIKFLPGYERLPLARTRTWTDVEIPQCIEREFEWLPGLLLWEAKSDPENCDGPPEVTHGRTHTVTQWQLSDANGDGYPDFLANGRILNVSNTSFARCDSTCTTTDGYALPDPTTLPPNNRTTATCTCEDDYRIDFWVPDPGVNHEVVAFYNRGGALFHEPTSGHGAPMPSVPVPRRYRARRRRVRVAWVGGPRARTTTRKPDAAGRSAGSRTSTGTESST